MSPEPSSRPRLAVRIITSYDVDVAGAADALLAMLRRATQPDAQAPNSEPREDSDGTDEATRALNEARDVLKELVPV